MNKGRGSDTKDLGTGSLTNVSFRNRFPGESPLGFHSMRLRRRFNPVIIGKLTSLRSESRMQVQFRKRCFSIRSERNKERWCPVNKGNYPPARVGRNLFHWVGICEESSRSLPLSWTYSHFSRPYTHVSLQTSWFEPLRKPERNETGSRNDIYCPFPSGV